MSLRRQMLALNDKARNRNMIHWFLLDIKVNLLSHDPSVLNLWMYHQSKSFRWQHRINSIFGT
jgi:hypothetical protein